VGFYHSPGWGQDFPRIQILTIEGLLHGAEVKMPPQYGTFNEAQRVHLSGGAHPQLDL
jgi:site-specific DNA-methyltransferase (adenine-specific)